MAGERKTPKRANDPPLPKEKPHPKLHLKLLGFEADAIGLESIGATVFVFLALLAIGYFTVRPIVSWVSVGW